MPPDVGGKVLNELRSHSVSEGETIFRQGEPFKGLYCVITGQLQVTGVALDGLPLLMAIHRAGDWTGFLAAFESGSYAFSVTAVVESRIAVLEKPVVEAIFESSVEAFKCLVRPENTVSRQNYRYFIEHFGRSPVHRIAERLIGLGCWAYSDKTALRPALHGVTQSDLATATRLSRQTVNKCLSKLETAGLISVGYGKVEVINPAGLWRVASGEDWQNIRSDCRHGDKSAQSLK